MKKEMSSFDVRSVALDMASLEGSHMDKIYQWGSGNVLFRINVQGEGKRDLFFLDRKWLYMPAEKPETPLQPTSFATYLRKYLDNARVGKIRQVGFDRIVEMELFKADAEYKVIFELFGGGNVLVLKDGKIDTCLIHRTMRDRVVRPGEEYVWPQTRFNPAESTEEEFRTVFRTSSADYVKTLATVTNLGGQYAEEVCARAGIDKKKIAAEATDEDLSKMYSAVREIVDTLAGGSEPTIYIQDGKAVDIAPVKMMAYADMEVKHFDTMSLAIDAYLENIRVEEEKNYVDPEIDKLMKRIAKQEETLEKYTKNSDSYKKKAEALYTDYQNASQLLEVLAEQSKKLSWDKLKEGAMKIPFVKSIEPSKNTVTATIGDETITLDYTKNLDANASDLYQNGKVLGEKVKRAEEALEESRRQLEKVQKGIDREKAKMAGKAKPTKQFWFERFKWFITSEGKLVIAGRDAHSNDNIVKKHLKEKDIYIHTDMHGAPSTIMKDGAYASTQEIREAGQFATAHSKGWFASISEGNAYWVYPDQVSKTPNPGEFVPRGAFIIRGKRNYEYHLPMEFMVGEIYYQGERKVMCAPASCFKDCDRYFIIHPGKNTGRMSKEMAQKFEVPEEEISRILPPGDVEIVKTVWPEDDKPEDE